MNWLRNVLERAASSGNDYARIVEDVLDELPLT
jgi:hypothetical protein